MGLFTKAELRSTTLKKAMTESVDSVLERSSKAFSEGQTYDIFLSHSYSDAEEIAKLKQKIEEMGFSVYVDWIIDYDLNRKNVTKETASRLRMRMRRCKSLFFVTSGTSLNSKWMPWELGYFDAFKSRVAILPIIENGQTSDYKGQEYLGLYPYVTKDPAQGATSSTLWIHENSNVYVSFKSWLEGGTLTRH